MRRSERRRVVFRFRSYIRRRSHRQVYQPLDDGLHGDGDGIREFACYPRPVPASECQWPDKTGSKENMPL